jgi:single-strand DNA-binding protein
MQSMNLVVLVGRLTADPELTTVGDNNTSKSRMTLAVNSTRSKEGPADFVNLEAWGATAEAMANYLHKGSLIGIQGELHVSSFESNKLVDDQGNPGMIYYTSVTVESFTFMETKKADEGTDNSQPRTSAQSNARAANRGGTRKTNSAGYGNTRRAAGGR